MVDKTQTIPKSKVGQHIGRVSPAVTERLDRSLVLFLGLGTRPRVSPSKDRAPSS